MSSKRQVVVAIDFGTTFSTIAWARVSKPESHYIVKQWPTKVAEALGGKTSDKVPTEVAYSYDGANPRILWGFQIPSDMPRLQWFKLTLGAQPDSIKALYKSQNKDRLGMRFPHHTTMQSVTTDYLRAIVDHFKKDLERQVGTATTTMEFTYIVTVPAVWTADAKQEFLACAEKAGLSSSAQIRIMSEPEAAAMHALQVSNSWGLSVEDTIMICDAGGSTVDVITFTIKELHPTLKLRECAPGMAGFCGSTFLNRRFENLLRERLGCVEGWKEDTLSMALQYFDSVVKCSFGGDENETFMVPVPGIGDNESLNVQRGQLSLSGKELLDIFRPVLQEIDKLVEEQIHCSDQQVKAVFFVGGFGQSMYLLDHVRSHISSGVQVLQPVDGWTAVARGALTKVLSDVSLSAPQVKVESRVARKHYGMINSVRFDARIHDPDLKVWCNFYGDWRIFVMHWFVNKGDDVSEDTPIIHEWFQQKPTSQGKFEGICLKIHEFDSDGTPPIYLDENTMPVHAVLHLRFDTIPRRSIPRKLGADGRYWNQISFQTHANYYSAHCEYALWFEGKDHGSVKVDYA